MTLPVVDSWAVRAVDGPKYKVGPGCSNPDCNRWAEHAHHMVRHSQERGKDFDWVEIEGKVYPNLTGLCAPCHDMVTGRVGGHRAAIRLNAEENLFYWSDIVESPETGKVIYLPFKPLDPQPPVPDSLAQRASHETEPESCPFCGQTRRRRRGESPPSAPGAPRRRRKTWPVPCPDDAENGADVLDSLYEDLAPHLHVDPTASGRYFVVMPTLYYAHQNIASFLDSIRGVGA